MKKRSGIYLGWVCVLAASVLACGAADGGRPPVVLRHQFIGAEAVAALPKAPKAVELLSSTNALSYRKSVADRFATWLAGQAGKSDAATVGGLAEVIHQVVPADAAVELRKGGGTWELTLAVKASAATPSSLEDTVRAVAKSLGQTTSVESSGGWLLIGLGSKGGPALAEWKSAIASGGRPWKLEEGAVLSTEADLPKLSEFFGWAESPIKLAKVSLTITPQGENLKTSAKVTFPEAITWAQEAWKVPTNLVHDPLVNFTAIRSLGPVLRPGSSFAAVVGRQLGLSQTYLWTVSQVPFQYYIAFASSSPKAELDRLGEVVPGQWNPVLKESNSGEFGWSSNKTQIRMKSASLLAPFIMATNDAVGGWITGGMFPFVPSREPAPKELLDQFQNRKDLVYYDWEISQERVGFWRVLGQISPILGRKIAVEDIREVRRRFSTTERFLDGVASQLGNTVTEASVAGTNEFSVTRKSHLGLSGFELVRLARWLADSPSSLAPVVPAPGGAPGLPVPGNAPKPANP